MNTPLKITRVGNSAGVILPKELLAHLNAGVGETLSVVLTPRGEEVCKELIPAMLDFMTSMTEGFSIKEKQEFRDYLKRFRLNALLTRDRARAAADD